MSIYIDGWLSTLDNLLTVINQEYLSVEQAREILRDPSNEEKVMEVIAEASDYRAEIVF